MKNLFLLFFSIFILTASCQTEIDASLDAENDVLSPILLRANSDLSPNWDWTTDEDLDIYTSHPLDKSPVKLYGVKTPFYSQHELSEFQDMAPEDGWMLVFKNFGSNDISPIRDLPSFSLYNKYTGVLRIMTFIPSIADIDYSKVVGVLKASSSSSDHSLFTYYAEGDETTIKGFDPQMSVFYSTKSFNLNHHWISTDFILSGYDPEDVNRDIALDFELYGCDITNVEGEANGSIEQELSERKISGFWKFIGQLEQGLKSGVSFYNDSEKAIKTIKAIGEKFKKKESTTSNRQSSFITVAQAAYSAIGAVRGFIKGGKANTPTPIKFNADFDIQLKMELKKPIYSLKFSLRTDSNHASAIKPTQNISWGVFNLKDRIKYNVNHYKYYKENEAHPYKEAWDEFVNVNSPTFLSNIVHNPSLPTPTYKIGFVKKNGADILSTQASNARRVYYDGNGTDITYSIFEIVVEITHRYYHPTEGWKEASILKIFPITQGDYRLETIEDNDNGGGLPPTPF
ncbi:hypothetical protein FUAX_02380 [Fulvitalea axinellae]|uniref:Uncharacterized protein n=1 Tax=Fulvitalea axinellae TaxID=1182444 RepID=A0AAU9C6Y0_9BACT|nr:hypothetical protein FUAX_02380 [Fulvitalea axinellae]